VIKSFSETQLNSVRKIAIDTHTNFLKILQDQVDSIEFRGEELSSEQIHIKQIDAEVNHLAIDPISALLGELKLNHSIDSSIRLVLTGADLNQAMNSDLVRVKLVPLSL
jgi:hypothetical protein